MVVAVALMIIFVKLWIAVVDNDVHDNFDAADDNDQVNPGYAGEPNEVAGDADKQDEELLSVSARGQKF